MSKEVGFQGWVIRAGRNLSWLFVAICLAWPIGARADQVKLPTGGTFAAGSGSITSSGSTMTVTQTTPRGVINWSSFNVGPGATVNFNNGIGATLSRVLNGSMSSILGRINATGSVYLINPAGVVVGKAGMITTGGEFVVSTHDISPSAFMAGGTLEFKSDSGAQIVNLGTISALGGDVVFIANTVTNSGTISAPNGAVALAGGNDVILQPQGTDGDRVQVKLTGDGSVTNDGLINAAKVQIAAAGGNVYALAGNNGGLIEATGIRNNNGTVELTAGGNVNVTGSISAKNADGSGGAIIVSSSGGAADVSGSLTASGTTGGNATVTGNSVHLAATASIDVSGSGNGGVAKIGGGFHGADSTVINALNTTIDAGAVIDASSTDIGNGGQVAVWSNGATQFAGDIVASGGPSGGDGGYVEVSGKGQLNYVGTVDTLAPLGKTGTLLLDPATLDITDSYTSGDDDPANTNGGTNKSDYSSWPGKILSTDGAGDTTYLSPAAINSALATSDVVLQATGNITLHDSTNGINSNAANSLAIEAGGNLTINTSLSHLTVGGNLYLYAGVTGFTDTFTNHVLTAPTLGTSGNLVATGSGSIVFLANGASGIDMGAGGDIDISVSSKLTVYPENGVADLSAAQDISSSTTFDIQTSQQNVALAPVIGTGVLTLTLAGGNLSLSNPITADTLQIVTSGTVTDTAPITVETLSLNGQGNYSLTNTTNAVGSLTAYANSVDLINGSTSTLTLGLAASPIVFTPTSNFEVNSATIQSAGPIVVKNLLDANAQLALSTASSFTNDGTINLYGGTILIYAPNASDVTEGQVLNVSGNNSTPVSFGTIYGNTIATLPPTSAPSGDYLVLPTALTVSGIVYSDYGATPLGGATVDEMMLSGGSILASAASAANTGAYSVTAPGSNGTILLFLSSGGTVADTVVDYSGSPLTGVNLYGNTLTFVNPSATTLSSLLSELSAFTAPNGYSSSDFLFNGTTPTANLTLTGLGSFTLDQALNLGSDTLSMSATGTVTESQPITAANLLLDGSSATYNLSSTNAIGTLAADAQAVMLNDGSTALSIGSVDGVNGVAVNINSGIINLTDTNTVTQTQLISTPNLELLGPGGSFTLSGSNNYVYNFAANTGSIALNDGSHLLDVYTVGSTSGVTLTGNLSVMAAEMTEFKPISAAGLELLGAGGDYRLYNQTNAIGTLAADTDTVELNNGSTPLSIGTVNGTNGATLTTELDLIASGSVSQTQPISAPTLSLQGAGGSYVLGTNNSVGTLGASTGSVVFSNGANPLDIGYADGAYGVQLTGDFALTDAVSVTQSEPLNVAGLALLGGGSFTLANTANTFSTLSANAGALNLQDSTDLTIGTVGGTTGLTSSAAVTLVTTGMMTLNSGAVVTGGSGDDVVLSTTGAFINDNATGGVSVSGGGRFLIYSSDSSGDTLGGITAPTVINGETYATLQPSAVGQTGNVLLYASGTNNNGGGTNNNGGGTNNNGGGTNSGGQLSPTATISGTVYNSDEVTPVSSATVNEMFLSGNSVLTSAVSSSSGTYSLGAPATDGKILLFTSSPQGIYANTIAEYAGSSLTDVNLYAGDVTFINPSATNLSSLLAELNGFTAPSGFGPYTFLFGYVNKGDAIGGVKVTGLSDFSLDTPYDGSLELDASGTVTQTSNGTVTGSVTLTGAGADYVLTNTGNELSVEANTGSITLTTDQSGANLYNITLTGDLTVTTSGAITGGSIVAPAASLAARSINLSGNNIGTIAANSNGSVTFDNGANPLTIGTVGGINGIIASTVSGVVTLNDTATVTQTQPITAAYLSLEGAGGTYNLKSANDVQVLAANTGSIALNNVTDLGIGQIGSVNGVTLTGDFTLSDTGNVTQSEPIAASDLALSGAGNFALNSTSNTVGTITANVGSLSYNNGTEDLTVGTVGENSGITASGAVTLATGGNLTLASGSTVQVRKNTDVVLSAGNNFANDNQSGGVSVSGTGRWLIYSAKLEDAVLGDLTANSRIFSNTIATLAPSAVSQTGNVLIYAEAPLIIGTVYSDFGKTPVADATVHEMFINGTSLLSSFTTGSNGAFDISAPSTKGTLLFFTSINGMLANTVVGYTGDAIEDANLYAGFLTFASPAATTLSGTLATLSGFKAPAGYTGDFLFSGTAPLSTADVAFLLPADFDFDENFTVLAGTLVLSSTANVTQSAGAISVNDLDLLGSGGSFTLTQANAVKQLEASTGTINLNDGATGLTIGSDNIVSGVTVDSALALSDTSRVVQTAAVNAPNLELMGSEGFYDFTSMTNDVGTLSADTGTVGLDNGSNTLLIGTGMLDSTSGVTVSDELTLNTTGLVYESAPINATDVLLQGASGNFILNGTPNAIETLAANTSTINLDNGSTNLAIGTVEGVKGIAVVGGLLINDTGVVTQTSSISAPYLALTGGGGEFDLTNDGNAITGFAANTGTVRLNGGSTPLTIGDVAGVDGVTTTNLFAITDTDQVAQTDLITTPQLSLLGTGGVYALDNKFNVVGTLAGNTGSVELTTAQLGFTSTPMAIGTVDGTNGLTLSGSLNLTSGFGLTQTQPITAAGAEFDTGLNPGAITLGGSNKIALVSAQNVSGFTLNNAATVVIGSVGGVSGISSNGNILITTSGKTSDIVVAPGALLTPNGNTLVLATSNNFVNDAGPGFATNYSALRIYAHDASHLAPGGFVPTFSLGSVSYPSVPKGGATPGTSMFLYVAAYAAQGSPQYLVSTTDKALQTVLNPVSSLVDASNILSQNTTQLAQNSASANQSITQNSNDALVAQVSSQPDNSDDDDDSDDLANFIQGQITGAMAGAVDDSGEADAGSALEDEDKEEAPDMAGALLNTVATSQDAMAMVTDPSVANAFALGLDVISYTPDGAAIAAGEQAVNALDPGFSDAVTGQITNLFTGNIAAAGEDFLKIQTAPYEIAYMAITDPADLISNLGNAVVGAVSSLLGFMNSSDAPPPPPPEPLNQAIGPNGNLTDITSILNNPNLSPDQMLAQLQTIDNSLAGDENYSGAGAVCKGGCAEQVQLGTDSKEAKAEGTSIAQKKETLDEIIANLNQTVEYTRASRGENPMSPGFIAAAHSTINSILEENKPLYQIQQDLQNAAQSDPSVAAALQQDYPGNLDDLVTTARTAAGMSPVPSQYTSLYNSINNTATAKITSILSSNEPPAQMISDLQSLQTAASPYSDLVTQKIEAVIAKPPAGTNPQAIQQLKSMLSSASSSGGSTSAPPTNH